MERRAKVELFEQIRREYEFGEGTVLGVARKLRHGPANVIVSAGPEPVAEAIRLMSKIKQGFKGASVRLRLARLVAGDGYCESLTSMRQAMAKRPRSLTSSSAVSPSMVISNGMAWTFSPTTSRTLSFQRS